MATLPNPETLARELIAVLHAAGLRPGDGMPTMAARQQFGIHRPAADFQAAAAYAETHGWIQFGRDGFWMTLTELGYSEA
jgi:hypothetical protein